MMEGTFARRAAIRHDTFGFAVDRGLTPEKRIMTANFELKEIAGNIAVHPSWHQE